MLKDIILPFSIVLWTVGFFSCMGLFSALRGKRRFPPLIIGMFWSIFFLWGFLSWMVGKLLQFRVMPGLQRDERIDMKLMIILLFQSYNKITACLEIS